MMVESSTKQYPTSFNIYSDRQNLKAAPCPASLRRFSRDVLTTSHMSRTAPFTWPSPFERGFSGTAYFSPPYLVSLEV